MTHNEYFYPTNQNRQAGGMNNAYEPPYYTLNSSGSERSYLDQFEAQVKHEFESNFDQGDFQHQSISASMPDIRSIGPYSGEENPGQNLQRSKSLSHPPNFDVHSNFQCQPTVSPKIKKKSSRPRMYKFNPKPLTLNPQMKRNQTASDEKNGDYWEKRKKNNEASRRSRLARRLKECMVMEEMRKLKKENDELKAELLKLQDSVGSCRM